MVSKSEFMYAVKTDDDSEVLEGDQRQALERCISMSKIKAKAAKNEEELERIYDELLLHVEKYKKANRDDMEVGLGESQDVTEFFTALFKTMNELSQNVTQTRWGEHHHTDWMWSIDKNRRYINMKIVRDPTGVAREINEEIDFQESSSGQGMDSLLNATEGKRVKRSIITNGGWYIELE
jgi:hypothetical protein